MKRQFQTKQAKKSSLLQRCATLAAVSAVAGFGIGCGVVPQAERSAPTANKQTISDMKVASTKAAKEPAKKYIPQVKATWARLDIGGDVKLLVEWGGGAILLAEKEGTTSLHTVGTELQAGLYADTQEIMSFKGKLRGLLAKADQLLILREMGETVELALGTMVEGALQWKTIQTYQASEAPQFLRQYSHEVLLLGQGRMARYSWALGKVQQLTPTMPKHLEQVTCEGDRCIALFKNQTEPMALNADWKWSKVELELEQSATESGAQHEAPVLHNRSLSFRDGQLLYTVNGLLFMSCDLGTEPLRRIESNEDLLAAQWAGISLARLYKHTIRLHRGEKRADLVLPSILARASAKEFALKSLKSTGHFMLLKNTENTKGYNRYHIAYHSTPLAANPACQ